MVAPQPPPRPSPPWPAPGTPDHGASDPARGSSDGSPDGSPDGPTSTVDGPHAFSDRRDPHVGPDRIGRRPGDLTAGWTIVTGVGWLAIAVALAGVWSASRQLGLSTWWLGPTADPRPLFVTVIPFAPALLMVAGALNRSRYLPLWGLAGAAVIAAVGVGDLGRVRGFGVVELAVAGAGAALSIATLSGMYRRSGHRGRTGSVAAHGS